MLGSIRYSDARSTPRASWIRVSRIAGMELKSEIRDREFHKPTRRRKHVEFRLREIPSRTEESRRGHGQRRRVRQFSQFGNQLPFPVPSQLRRAKLNNSPPRLRPQTKTGNDDDDDSVSADGKTANSYVYSDDGGIARYLTEFGRLVCRMSIDLKVFNREIPNESCRLREASRDQEVTESVYTCVL